MIHFWKWLGLSVAVAALGYGALFALSTVALPWRPAHFDTHVVNTTERGWVNEARYFVLNRETLAAPGDRIVILGASNARDPFRPALMEPMLPGWTVANASLSGASIGELADAVDLVYQARAPGTGGRTVFVVSLNYLQFLPPRAGENPLATEAKRGGLYERQDGRLEARYSREVQGVMEAVFRPQAVAASLPRRTFSAVFVNPDLPQVKNFADRFRGADPLSRWTEFIGEHPSLDTVTVPEDVQRALLAQRLTGAGGDRALPAAGFRQLADLIARIRTNGDAVVILDLPLPEWHRLGVPVSEASYQQGVAAVLAQHRGDPSVAFVTLKAFDEDENFFDSAHTEPRLWPVLSRRLAQDLAVTGVLTAPR